MNICHVFDDEASVGVRFSATRAEGNTNNTRNMNAHTITTKNVRIQEQRDNQNAKKNERKRTDAKTKHQITPPSPTPAVPPFPTALSPIAALRTNRMPPIY